MQAMLPFLYKIRKRGLLTFKTIKKGYFSYMIMAIFIFINDIDIKSEKDPSRLKPIKFLYFISILSYEILENAIRLIYLNYTF